MALFYKERHGCGRDVDKLVYLSEHNLLCVRFDYEFNDLDAVLQLHVDTRAKHVRIVAVSCTARNFSSDDVMVGLPQGTGGSKLFLESYFYFHDTLDRLVFPFFGDDWTCIFSQDTSLPTVTPIYMKIASHHFDNM